MVTMYCLPIKEWILRKKNCPEIESHQHKTSTKGKYISKVKEFVKSLPTEDLIEWICHWLENYENEKQNYSFKEESDDSLSSIANTATIINKNQMESNNTQYLLVSINQH